MSQQKTSGWQSGDLWWRIRCYLWLWTRLDASWGLRQLWSISGTLLSAEQENRAKYGEPMPFPRDAVDEELSCWTD